MPPLPNRRDAVPNPPSPPPRPSGGGHRRRAGSAPLDSVLSLPADGWACDRVRDARAAEFVGNARCGFCGRRLRWVHPLRHEDHSHPVEAGRCCAARLCYGYDARGAERDAANRAARFARFINPRNWRPSWKNPANVCREASVTARASIKVTVYMYRVGYKVFLSERGTDEVYAHPPVFPSPECAKAEAFELIETLREAEAGE